MNRNYAMLDDVYNDYSSSLKPKEINDNSELSKVFFSKENIKRIQKLIRKEVFRKTNGQFKLDVDQDEKSLVVAMQNIYLENAQFLPDQPVRQTKRLNRKVIEETVPRMITEIKQGYGYLQEINKPLQPIPRPISVSNAGRRQLPSFNF